ncbi:hypothetical protein [Pseudolactococcus hodotermopsidis]|nr:hypothetical protein [Lactococcus hodotermopsidis]
MDYVIIGLWKILKSLKNQYYLVRLIIETIRRFWQKKIASPEIAI